MLKKAGIAVAVAAAGLLALSPLAFAGEGHHGHHAGDTNVEKSYEDNSQETYEDNDKAAVESGLVNVAGNNTSVPVNACDIQVPVNVLGVQVPLNDTDAVAGLTGALGAGVLGEGDADNRSESDTSVSDDCTAVSDIQDETSNKIDG